MGKSLMATRRAPLTETEATRYLRAMKAAGFEAGRIEIDNPDGTRIRLVVGQAGGIAGDDAGDDIDRLISKVPHAPTS